MSNEENFGSELMVQVLLSCYNSKELRSKLDSYCNPHGNAGSLSIEREKWKPAVEEVIDKIRIIEFSGLRPLIRHQPTEVQYFLFERFCVIEAVLRFNPNYLLQLDISSPFVDNIVLSIRDLWAENMNRVLDAGLDFDEYVLQIYNQLS